jgi:cellulose synthase/poly-beta-1,6-N-acetylglucosamine synthase-like glycosyltransferase
LFFFIAELLGLMVNLGSLWLMVVSVDRSPPADRLSQAVISKDFCPWVDVWVLTYNESEELLRRTIIGCQAMDYPHKRVYLLNTKNGRECDRWLRNWAVLTSVVPTTATLKQVISIMPCVKPRQ